MPIDSRAGRGASRLAGVVMIVVAGGCSAAAPTPAASIPSPSSASVAPSVAASSTALDAVIAVDPAEVQIGEPGSIRLSGFPPNHEVTVRATTVGLAYPDLRGLGNGSRVLGDVPDRRERRRRSGDGRANQRFLLDRQSDGPVLVDDSGCRPRPGHDDGVAAPDSPNPGAFLQYRTELTAEVDGAPVATATLDQDLGSPDVTMTEISEDGLLGQFYLPPGPGPFPAVIVLSGSSGGVTLRRPKVFAAEGYAVLSLPYFNYTSPIDGTELPSATVELPLEYFGKAIDWLQAQPGVDPDRIGIYGTSLGGQVAMLVGARYPEIKSVIAIAPPTVTWDGGPGKSSFSFKGKSVPYAAPFGVEAMAQPFRDAVAAGAGLPANDPGHRRERKGGP